jgi:hypothetical protein
MGTQPATHEQNDAALARAWVNVEKAKDDLLEVEAALAELGEFDPRVNLRVSIHGALELVELIRGAVEHARRR